VTCAALHGFRANSTLRRDGFLSDERKKRKKKKKRFLLFFFFFSLFSSTRALALFERVTPSASQKTAQACATRSRPRSPSVSSDKKKREKKKMIEKKDDEKRTR
jgi:hypothetical protein